VIKKLVNSGVPLWVALLSVWWVACGSSTDSPLALHVHVANVQQAVQNTGGLDAAVQGLEVEFSRNGTVLATSGCLTITANASERSSIPFDLTPGENTTVIVNGYENTDCSDTAHWQGKSFGVAVQEGHEVQVPIYVTRRGQQLNPIRGTLPAPRAFSSASLLSDGRVLVAGGFVGSTKKDNVIKLQAACDAVLYDPGTATFSKSIPLAAGCRGLHRALMLSDGRILLVGGSGSATLDPSGLKRPLVLADVETLVSSAEIFDPAIDSFESVGISAALQRSDAAAVLAGTQVVVLGGRTNLLRSDEIVRRLTNNDWEVDSVHLSAARSGAQAVCLLRGIVVAGGNAEDVHTIELLRVDTFEQLSLPSEALNVKAVSGHTLTQIGTNGVLMVGGVFINSMTAGLSDIGFGIRWTNTTPVVSQIQLRHPRAYHAAETLPDGKIMVAGGFDGELKAATDLEILDTANPTNTPTLLEGNLSIGPIGMASARLLDDSILLVGGLDLATNGGVTLSGDAQLLAP
jgi:hypothetical protein